MAVTTSIDSIVHSALMTLQLPLHWYIDGLHYGLKCVQEMGYRDLPNIKSVRLTISAAKTVTLPTDYVDWIRIGTDRGQYVSRYGADRNMNRLAPATGTSYGDVFADSTLFPYNWAYYPSHLTDYNEFNGRFFGQTPTPSNNFLEVRERGVIQMDSTAVVGTSITLDYIYFDSAAATSLVHPYAALVIEAYIVWKIKETSRGMQKVNRFEAPRLKDEYHVALRQFRANIFNITIQDMERAIRSGNYMTPKI
jgi:hypothetical protein